MASVSVLAQTVRSNGGGAAVSPPQVVPDNASPIPVVDERDLGLDAAAVVAVDNGNPSSIGAILRTVLALAVTAAAVYGVVYLLKRVTRQNDVKDPHLKIGRAHV